MTTYIMQPLITVTGGSGGGDGIAMPPYAVLDLRARQDATISVRVHSAASEGGGGVQSAEVVIETADLNEDDYFVTLLTTATGSTATFSDATKVETVDSWQGDEARDNASPSGPRRSGRYLRWRVLPAVGTPDPNLWSITFEIIVTVRGL